MNRQSPCLWIGVLIATCVAPLVWWVKSTPGLSIPPAGFETGLDYVASFTAYYLVFVVAALPVHFGLPPRLRDPFMAAAGLVFLATAFSPATAVACLAAVAVLYLLLQSPRCVPVLFVVWSVVFYGLVPPWLFSMTQGKAMMTRAVDAEAVAFFALFYKTFKRAAFVTLERTSGRAARPRFLDLLNYFSGLPFLAINAATPSYVHYLECRSEHPAEVVVRGARTCLLCMACFGFWLLTWSVGKDLYRAYAQSPHVAWLVVATAGLWFLRYFTRRMASEQLSVGVCRLFGRDVRDDFQLQVLLSRNVLEYWRHWNMLWREFLVSWIYYPLLLKMGRSHGRTAPWMLGLAGFLTLLGAVVFDVLPRGFYFVFQWSPVMTEFALTMLLYRVLWGLLVGGTLFWQASVGKRFARFSGLLAPLQIALTLTVICLLHLLAVAGVPLHDKLETVYEVLGL